MHQLFHSTYYEETAGAKLTLLHRLGWRLLLLLLLLLLSLNHHSFLLLCALGLQQSQLLLLHQLLHTQIKLQDDRSRRSFHSKIILLSQEQEQKQTRTAKQSEGRQVIYQQTWTKKVSNLFFSFFYILPASFQHSFFWFFVCVCVLLLLF